MTNQKFPEDFEREAQKDFIYLYEEQRLLMQEIAQEKLPAKIEIIGELPPIKTNKDEAEHNTLPF